MCAAAVNDVPCKRYLFEIARCEKSDDLVAIEGCNRTGPGLALALEPQSVARSVSKIGRRWMWCKTNPYQRLEL